MRTVGKILVGLAILAVVLVAGVAIVALTVDPNTLIAPVQAKIKAATGRDLTVRGGARIALSLNPRIVLRDVALGNAPGGATGDMVKAERVELTVALIPLLSRRFELREIALVKPEVALETDGTGARNWEFPSTGGSAVKGGSDNLAAAVAIGDIEISDGIVTYRDGPNAPVSRVTIEKVSLRPRALSSTVAVQFRGVAADIAVALEGTVGNLESLLAKRWPYPIELAGEIAGQKTALATNVRAEARRYTLDDLKLTLGTNAVTGSFAVDAGRARPKLLFDLATQALALNALPRPATVAASAAASPPSKAARAYVFPETPVSFAPLRWVDAQGKLAIGKLTLADGRQYDNLRMSAALDAGRLQVPDLSAALFGGTLAGSVVIDAARSDATALTIRLDGKGMSLGSLLAAVGQPREVRGGKTDVSVNLAMRGNSPHAWASTATGNVLLVSGPATLTNAKLANLTSTWDKISDAINPFRTRDPSTELVCAVARLPIVNGVAKVDRSLAMETQKLGVSASGTLDFRDETLDFTFQPKARKGVSIDFAGFSDLVRVTGPFTSPHLAVDVAGSAKVIASVGAAVSTGGLSAVGQALFTWAEGSGPGPCQIALGGAAARASTNAAPAGGQGSVPIAGDIGKALGKIFGR